jgi:hypothetical protein
VISAIGPGKGHCPTSHHNVEFRTVPGSVRAIKTTFPTPEVIVPGAAHSSPPSPSNREISQTGREKAPFHHRLQLHPLAEREVAPEPTMGRNSARAPPPGERAVLRMAQGHHQSANTTTGQLLRGFQPHQSLITSGGQR